MIARAGGGQVIAPAPVRVAPRVYAPVRVYTEHAYVPRTRTTVVYVHDGSDYDYACAGCVAVPSTVVADDDGGGCEHCGAVLLWMLIFVLAIGVGTAAGFGLRRWRHGRG